MLLCAPTLSCYCYEGKVISLCLVSEWCNAAQNVGGFLVIPTVGFEVNETALLRGIDWSI